MNCTLDIICLNCEGRHFQCEEVGTANVFSQCCEKGKFSLPAYKDSEVVRDLLHGRLQESANFKKNIRSYSTILLALWLAQVFNVRNRKVEDRIIYESTEKSTTR